MIARIGQALFGEEQWRSRLAEALQVSYRTVRRWELGKKAVPESVIEDCAELLRERGLKIDELKDRLPGAGE